MHHRRCVNRKNKNKQTIFWCCICCKIKLNHFCISCAVSTNAPFMDNFSIKRIPLECISPPNHHWINSLAVYSKVLCNARRLWLLLYFQLFNMRIVPLNRQQEKTNTRWMCFVVAFFEKKISNQHLRVCFYVWESVHERHVQFRWSIV